MCLTKKTIVVECNDTDDTPKLRFNFIPIPKLRQVELTETKRSPAGRYGPLKEQEIFAKSVDAIGIVHHVGPLGEIGDKPEKKLPKREIAIYDQAGVLFPVVLWSYNAEEFDADPGTIVAFRNARLTEIESYHDEDIEGTYEFSLVLSVITPSTVHLEPDVEERFVLDQWRHLDCDLISIPTNRNPKHMLLGTLCES